MESVLINISIIRITDASTFPLFNRRVIDTFRLGGNARRSNGLMTPCRLLPLLQEPQITTLCVNLFNLVEQSLVSRAQFSAGEP